MTSTYTRQRNVHTRRHSIVNMYDLIYTYLFVRSNLDPCISSLSIHKSIHRSQLLTGIDWPCGPGSLFFLFHVHLLVEPRFTPQPKPLLDRTWFRTDWIRFFTFHSSFFFVFRFSSSPSARDRSIYNTAQNEILIFLLLHKTNPPLPSPSLLLPWFVSSDLGPFRSIFMALPRGLGVVLST